MGWLHIPGILNCPDLELYALCDINQASLERTAKEYSIDKSLCFTDYNELLNCDKVDAVTIATTNDTHFPIAMAAVRAGIPYLLEKPITMNCEEADILAAATIKSGVKNMVCFSKRFYGAVRYARDLVRCGKIGNVYHADIQYFHSWCLPYRNVGMVWRFDQNKTGGGVSHDLGSHCIDLVRFITGEEFSNVSARTDTFVKNRPYPDGSTGNVGVDDSCIFFAGLSGGGSALIHVSNVAYGRNDYQRLEIYGTEGAIIYQNNLTDLAEDELYLCLGEDYAVNRIFSKMPIQKQYKSDLMQSFADMLNGCEDGLAATIVDGQISQSILEKVQLSAKQKEWINI
jgi:predicted dehydrogenase